MNENIINDLQFLQFCHLDIDGAGWKILDAAIAALSAPGCWQPFATVPRDGTPFLLGITARCNPETHHIEEQAADGSWTRVMGEPKRWHPMLNGEHAA